MSLCPAFSINFSLNLFHNDTGGQNDNGDDDKVGGVTLQFSRENERDYEHSAATATSFDKALRENGYSFSPDFGHLVVF